MQQIYHLKIRPSPEGEEVRTSSYFHRREAAEVLMRRT
jgi:hypothetical protein